MRVPQKVCALGYESSHVLMVGDALGDKESADAAGIPFSQFLPEKKRSHGRKEEKVHFRRG